MTGDARAIRSYGRIKSRPIKPRQAELVDSELPRLTFLLGADPRTLRPEAREVWLEVGFGGGEHLAAQAARNPQALLIGAEPFLNGVASAVRHVHEQGLENVRLHAGDVRDLMAALPEGAVDRAFILFPDPWPKVRHHKRRLIQPAFISDLARVMRPGARLRFVTDWRDYAAWALERLLNHNDFDWAAERADDWRQPPADHVTTRYEDKRLGDTAPLFLEFTRR
jgi:tRNA (guanine-N7-)-methyltransferase